METVAFATVARNGIIAIPEEYRTLFPETVHVVVHIEPIARQEGASAQFKAVRISTKGFKLNREEANERQGLL